MRLLPAAVVSLVVIGLAAGCGGGSGTEEQTGQATSYTDCLRQNGIAVPTVRASGMPGGVRPSGFPTARPSGMPTGMPGGGPGGGQGGFPGGGGGQLRPSGVDDATWQKALEACGSLRPSGGPGGNMGGGGDGRNEAYLDCLSQYGVTPSPGMTLPTAAAACDVLRASRGPQ